MAGRSTDMDASRTASRETRWHSRWRSACVLAGLLCILGLATGAATRATHTSQHRTPAVAAVATPLGSYGTSLGDDHHFVAATSTPTTTLTRAVAAQLERHHSRDIAATDSVRTRGPPALAS